jgi:fatty-acyl-CoA synthase
VRSSRLRSKRAINSALGSGLVPRMRPDRQIRARSLARRGGLTAAAAYRLAALRYPHELAIIDDRGSMTFADVDVRTDALARSFRGMGIGADATVGVMCRNHRGVIEATVACARIGADILYLDPDATPLALLQATSRRPPDFLIYDDELSDQVRTLAPAARRLIAWCEPGLGSRHPTLDELALEAPLVALPKTTRMSKVVFAYEAVGKKLPCSLVTPSTANAQLPLRRRDPVLLAAPLATRWGFLNFTLSLRFAATLVLMRHFDPEAVLCVIDDQRVAALALSRDMLEEITDLHPCRSGCHNTESLNVICVPGSCLPSAIAMPAIKRFGDILYNLRGTTIIRIGPELWSRHLDPVSFHPSVA